MAQSTPFNRGVNLSGWFQAGSPQEIQYNRYGREDFEQMKNLGVDVIRLPINLHFMTNGAPDYILDPLFLRNLDQVVNWTEELGIHLILDNHTFDPAVSTDPEIGGVLEKVWSQMAEHFKDRSMLVYYEVLNEPRGISDEDWNAIQQSVVEAIRVVDQRHTIIVGPAGWNSYNNLEDMPAYEDDNLIYTFHFYDPFLFTHQGASWVEPSMEPLAGVPFPYDAEAMPELPQSLEDSWIENAYNNYPTDGTVTKVEELLDIAIQFRDERKVPIYLGELGVLMNNSENEDRVSWYQAVREYLDENNVSWTMWDYHGGFGVFEQQGDGSFDHDLNLPLLQAVGFEQPPQTPSIQTTDNVGFPVYFDAVAGGINGSRSGDGTLEYYSQDRPYDGNYSLRWTDASRYGTVGFDFVPDKDLSFLKDQAYVLDFRVRGDTPGTSLSIRFLDSDTQDPADRPWRMQATLDETIATWDNTWHRVQIPLTDFVEAGAWEDGNWYNPQGDFDWTAVDRLEIVSDDADLSGVNFWFDNIQVSRPASDSTYLSNTTGANGLFYDPRAPGHGFDFNYHQAGLTIFYYGHTSTGGRLWLISENYTGNIQFNQSMEITFYEVVNGSFGAPQPPETQWGTITITLTGCNTAVAEFNGLDGMIDMELVRLAGLPDTSCH